MKPVTMSGPDAPSDQADLFDKARAIEARDAGMEVARLNRRQTLDVCRQIAHQIGRVGFDNRVSADDVYAEFHRRFGFIPDLGAAAGSLFKGVRWECAGWVQSTRVSNHGRWIRSWRLKR